MIDDELTNLVTAYELAQRNRIATAAHVRAGHTAAETMGELHAIELRTERSLARRMGSCVREHPAWCWLEQVRGIGPTLSARLLARLRIDRAPTPSSFWKFCGLSTVEGSRYTCPRCGASLLRVRGTAPPRRHRAPDGEHCEERLDDTPPGGIVRVAARLPSRGQARTFDVGARSLCHLIGVSFLRRGGKYRAVYYTRRERINAQHPDWTPLHSHLAGMRVMEKLFLAHLWSVWSEKAGMPARTPYPVWMRGRGGVSISPWEMVD
jgi:hypothetical protein